MINYDTFMQPLEKLYLAKIRKILISKAYGKVLEIGFGSGVNMQYYDFKKVKTLDALDISENMRKFDNVNYHVLSAAKLPFEARSFDCVVLTLALCSVEDQRQVLSEIRRVLKDDGYYLFLEHERPNNKILSSLFNVINPIWRKLAGGCQINLATHKTIIDMGFTINYQRKNVFYYGLAKK